MLERGVGAAYDEVPCDELRTRAGASQVIALEHCTSTMDIAHQLAADGAPHGTVVVAEGQGAGRGRSGKVWQSARGAGVWTSVLLRTPVDAPPGVLSLRVGLALAASLDACVDTRVELKWPNDLLLRGRKLAGVLTEARWRGDLLEWIVVGVGVNVRETGLDGSAAALGSTARPAAVLVDIVRAVLVAARARGELSADEMSAFAARDFSVGRQVVEPLDGIVLGVSARGGVRVRTASGDAVAVSGSLVFRSLTSE